MKVHQNPTNEQYNVRAFTNTKFYVAVTLSIFTCHHLRVRYVWHMRSVGDDKVTVNRIKADIV
jgi:hypothetical protein